MENDKHYISFLKEQACKKHLLSEESGPRKEFTEEEAKSVGDEIGVNWQKHSLKNFTAGMNVELEHGLKNPKTNVTDDCPFKTGKIALVHMEEVPGTGNGDDYYSLLKKHVEGEEK